MALNKKQRAALADSDFAVPSKRVLPIQDKAHIKMSWGTRNETKGLSLDEKKEATANILMRAKEFGMDTSDWDVKAEIDEQDDLNKNVTHDEQKDEDSKSDAEIKEEMEKQQEQHEQREDEKLQGAKFVFSALAMEIPDGEEEHPNKVPFKGVLTRIDEPSDNPLSGSFGKTVILPKDVAEKALSSLLGMGIDATPELDGHDVKFKIGIITAATIVGNEINIEGFFYGADFPELIKRIQAEKSLMGFSYEAQAQIRSMNDDPLVMKNCVFTGAAVLYKDKAAYTTTSLQAKMENQPMSPEEKVAFDKMQEQITALTTQLKANEEKLALAGGSIANMVKPHSDKIRACADGMEAAGMGMHAKAGHVAVLHSMADNMDADAAMGKMPHIYQTNDFYSAGADKSKTESVAASAEIKKLSDVISDLSSQMEDLKKAKFHGAAQPERVSLDATSRSLLIKGGIGVSEDAGKLTVSEIDKTLANSHMSTTDRIQAKLALSANQRIAN